MKKSVMYFLLVLFLFVFLNPLLNFLNKEDENCSLNYLLEQENLSLKKEIDELSGISYTNYRYTIAKITVRNLYNSDCYWLSSSKKIFDNHPVITKDGLIGITSGTHILKPVSDLTLSVKCGYVTGILQENKLIFDGILVKEGESVFTSGLTRMPENIKVGVTSSCIYKDSSTTCDIEYNSIDSHYVLILEDYVL